MEREDSNLNKTNSINNIVGNSYEQMEAMCCVVMINRKWYRFCDEQVFELPELPLSLYNPYIFFNSIIFVESFLLMLDDI